MLHTKGKMEGAYSDVENTQETTGVVPCWNARYVEWILKANAMHIFKRHLERMTKS